MGHQRSGCGQPEKTWTDTKIYPGRNQSGDRGRKDFHGNHYRQGSQSTMLTVACVLKSGGVYTPEYVERLRSGVGQHLDHYKFVCLSDVDVPDRIPLENDWPGWWSK